MKIFNIKFEHSIRFDISWIQRKSNELSDKFSKTIDYDDWYATPDLLKMLTLDGGDQQRQIGVPQKEIGK